MIDGERRNSDRSGERAAQAAIPRAAETKHLFASEESCARFMAWCGEVNTQPIHFPSGIALGRIGLEEIAGVPTVRFSAERACERVVIYFHGGAFLTQPTVYQIRFCAELSQAVSARVMMPLFPLLPRYHCTDALAQLLPFCRSIFSGERLPVSMLGDSSGGGLCAAVCEELDESLRPEQLVLLSPWVDATMKNPAIEELESVDPVLAKSGLAMIGREWAGELGPDDARVSPINGDLSRLRNVTLFAGEREILRPDIVRFQQRLQNVGCHVKLFVGEGAPHVYPLFAPAMESEGFRQVCRALAPDDAG